MSAALLLRILRLLLAEGGPEYAAALAGHAAALTLWLEPYCNQPEVLFPWAVRCGAEGGGRGGVESGGYRRLESGCEGDFGGGGAEAVWGGPGSHP